MTKSSKPKTTPKTKSRLPPARRGQLREMRATAPQIPRPPVARRAPGLDHAVSKVCGLVDPFCEHAAGTKYPDDSSARTLSFTVHQSETVSTDANGKAALTIMPTTNFSSIIPTSVVGTTCTPQLVFPGTVVAQLSGINKYRVVSAGYRLRCVAPALTASGMVYVRTYGLESGGSLTTYNGTTYTGSVTHNVSLIECTDTAVILQHTSQMPQLFYTNGDVNPTNLTADWLAPGFGPSTVFLSGGPVNTPVLEIEYIMHVEYLFEEGTALALAATPAPAHSPMLTAAASAVTSLGTTAISTSYGVAAEFIKSAARKAILGAIASRFGPPGAAGAAMIMNVD